MMVLLVNTDSPAYNADMKVGDILLEINGKEINLIGDYHQAIAGGQGNTLDVKIRRKGQEFTVQVTFS